MFCCHSQARIRVRLTELNSILACSVSRRSETFFVIHYFSFVLANIVSKVEAYKVYVEKNYEVLTMKYLL